MDLFFPLFSGIWCLVGVIFGLIGGFMLYHRRQKERTCTMYTSATVTDVVRRRHHSTNGYRSTYFHPVFSYYVGGQEIVTESHFGSSKPKFTVGQTVELFYDPDRPERYYVPEETVGNLLGWIFVGVCGVCLAIALTVFYLGVVLR